MQDDWPTDLLVCPARHCLPDDTSEAKRRLCYTSVGGKESFASCVGLATPHCTKCMTTPPCESWCEAAAAAPLPLGSPCHLDRQCGGDPLASCHLGICRRTLWPGQRCDLQAENSVCLFGAQKCEKGVCVGLGTNEPCWDGYPAGMDLDCKIGWYCLQGLSVPQLPNYHTCYGRHPSECIRGHRCNTLGKRPQCLPEYSFPDGTLSSDKRLCQSSHIDPRIKECAQAQASDSGGGECRSRADCARRDGSYGECRCKVWWHGDNMPGFCELDVPDRERPSFMELWNLRKTFCHHDWPEERCAIELEEVDLARMVEKERQATADPTLPVPVCAHEMLGVVWNGRTSPRNLRFFPQFLSVLAASAAVSSVG